MIDTTTPPAGASPRGIAADLRRLADTPGHQLTDIYRQSLREMADWVAKLAEPATAELEAVAGGLEPEQECRARAAVALAWRSPGDTDTDEYRDWWWAELDRLAAWIRTGARP